MASERAGAPSGRLIARLSWASGAVFAATAVPAALGVDALVGAAAGVALGLFLVSLPVWLYALALAAVRTARGDDIAVSSLFLVQGTAPRDVRRSLLGSVAASVALAAATAAAQPFGVLVPMLPLGFCGLWGARHGTYPPRRMPGPATAPRPPAGPARTGRGGGARPGR